MPSKRSSEEVGWISRPLIAREKAENGRNTAEMAGSEDTALEDEALCGGSPALRFLVLDELGDTHQIVGQHRGTHQHLEPLAAFGPAPLHSPTAKQNGDAALNADPESLRFLECRAALQGFLLRGLLSAPLRDAHLADLGLLATLHIVGAVKAAISGVPLGRVLEGLLMTLQRLPHGRSRRGSPSAPGSR